MKHLNFYTNFKIQYLCKKYNITNYKINKDGTIDVDGDVDLSCVGFERLWDTA